ncbi:tail fiber domain-containing protein [Winogradskyella forsetii]|uniref:tail fiber domain-containing protein n=1 Tax=Winogradskyella forsetii TaxID=2686077 RepID=UPI0015BEFF6E|nr:T9SS type A sorting domain-containing protein [Winogradskyella forsetii]
MLNGYTYTYKENANLNFDEGLQHGLIAQEVEAVYPELVHNTTYPIYNEEGEFEGTGSYKSVNYIGLISELTEAIKGLNAKVENLESQLEPRVVYEKSFSAEELARIEKNAYQLSQNTPNPLSASTSITYVIPEAFDEAAILIFDLNGKMLKTYPVKENKGTITINSKDLNGAGMYLYALYANGKDIMTKRMLLK